MAIYQEVSYSLSVGKASLWNDIKRQAKGGKATDARLTWDGIHAFAQIQGSYYSYRILRQILELVLLYDNSVILPKDLQQLWIDLNSLPPLEALPSAADGIRELGGLDDQKILVMVHSLLEIHEGELEAVARVQKDKGKSKLKKTETGQRQKPKNIFEVLDAS